MADKPRSKSKDDAPPKRLNRAVAVAEALGGVLDPALKKRGFASRDILSHWPTIAPAPYLRCHPGHALALSHEGQRVAASINRYYGYFLIGQVRLSAEPFVIEDAVPETVPALPEVTRARISRTVERVSDPGVRDALRQLGQAIARRKPR